jgi:hypothetical protein
MWQNDMLHAISHYADGAVFGFKEHISVVENYSHNHN